MLKKLNNDNFSAEISNNGTVLLDFYADWCMPCQRIAPIVEEIANEHPDITVGKINVDESTPLAIKYNVASIPTLIIFKKGEIVWRQSGVFPANELEKLLINYK